MKDALLKGMSKKQIRKYEAKVRKRNTPYRIHAGAIRADR